MGTGNFTGNLLGALITVICALLGFLSYSASAVSLLICMYLIGGYWVCMDRFGYEEYLPEVQSLFTPQEQAVAKKYHLYLSAYMGPSQGVSALLNFLRLDGVIWSVIGLFYSAYWVLALAAVFFVGVSGVISRLDPGLYVGGFAKKTGDLAATMEILALESIQRKLERILEIRRGLD